MPPKILAGVQDRINIPMVLAVLPKYLAFWVGWTGHFSRDAKIIWLSAVG